ncbi:peptidoglycan-binding protein [Dactylosporangium vinaceum]|nr:peptidoglycan-binding protein [Dactylosporangium vinaceum]
MAVATATVAVTGLGVLIPETAHAATPACASYTVDPIDARTEFHTPTSAYGNHQRSCSLLQGASGWGVVVLQEALYACFGQNISRDGSFGPATKQALKNAQGEINSRYGAGLATDGEYGPNTAKWWWDAAYTPGGGVQRGEAFCRVHLGSL